MHIVELLLPLYDNDKRRFPREAYDRVREELTEQFGGVTAFLRAPAEGAWKENETEVNYDEVVIFEVMTDALDRDWWAAYRQDLAKRFRQDEIVARATASERL